jgi:Na+/phosphate symporter
MVLPCCLRAASPEVTLNAAALLDMEHHAQQVDARERCYLYTRLLQSWTQLASQQMHDGEEDEAAAALIQMDRVAGLVEATSQADAKRLQNAEQVMEKTAHHLSDMVRVATETEREAAQAALKHVNNAHDGLLALVFRK